MKHFSKKGFTLIETMVSLALFSIVVVAATGVILSVISASKKNQSINSVVNNLNYSVDSMIRDISTGYRYRCNYPDALAQLATIKLQASTCAGDTDKKNITLISTITGKEQIVRYVFVRPVDGSAGYIEKTVYREEGSNVFKDTYPLTDVRSIDVDALEFRVVNPPTLISGQTAGQPSVFLTLKGTAQVNQINISDFFIQTFVSQRLPNLI